LDVTIEQRRETDDNILGQVATGKYDFSVGSAVYRAQAEGAPVTAIAAIYQFGPDAFFARADSGIVTPADLAGRSVVVKSFGWQKMLEALLKHEGLTLDDIQTVEGGRDMTPFFNDEVEVWAGYLTNEIIRARRQGLELVVLPLYEYGIATVAQTIATSQTLLESRPDQAIRFLRASLRGWKWAIEHPSEAVDIMLKLYPEMADECDFHLAAFDASIPLILPPGTRIGMIDCEAWRSHELFANLKSTEGLCTTEILEKAWAGIQEGK
jgi:ABC-type nitrate/sulfonate/bicarbonate transport system substrate-binding protein